MLFMADAEISAYLASNSLCIFLVDNIFTFFYQLFVGFNGSSQMLSTVLFTKENKSILTRTESI